MELRFPAICPNCRGKGLFTRRTETRGWSFAPLAGLGGFLHYAFIDVVVCSTCGHCMFFADKEAAAKVSTASGWQPLNDP